MDVQGNEKPQLSLGDNFSPGVCLSTSAVYGLTAAALRGHEALHISAMSYFEFMALAFFAVPAWIVGINALKISLRFLRARVSRFSLSVRLERALLRLLMARERSRSV